LVIGVSLGLAIGIGQWLTLRRLGNRANLWPLISTLALVFALMVGLPLGGEGRKWLSLGVIGLLAGTISGLGMMWLTRRQTALAWRVVK
jgi:NhaP-type Na+/H+ or K+/H+ antiporter